MINISKQLERTYTVKISFEIENVPRTDAVNNKRESIAAGYEGTLDDIILSTRNNIKSKLGELMV